MDINRYSYYEEMIETIDSISCTDKVPFVQIETDSTTLNILAYHDCSQEHLIADYKIRNIIGVNNDSIVINKDVEYGIDSLESILKKQYLSFGKDKDYAVSPDKALIFFYSDLDTNNEVVEKRLLRIINAYLSLSSKSIDSIDLKISFPFYALEFIDPPPLPSTE